MFEHLAPTLKNIPTLPGVYQYFDKEGTIIYIGKSVRLSSRVKSYFLKNATLNFGKKKMVSEIAKIEIIVTNTAVESLLLETNLIKKHKPKYNILMKDDKSHTYLKLTDEIFPKLIKTRSKNILSKTKKDQYFGPYISTHAVHNIIKITKKIFGHRSCNIEFGQEKDAIVIKKSFATKIPCIDYYIGRCAAPCLLEPEKMANYNTSIANIRHFLKGNYQEVLEQLRTQMQVYAQRLEFEKAKELKEDLESLQVLKESQIIYGDITGSVDIINYLEKYDRLYVCRIEMKQNKISGIYQHEIDNKLEDIDESLAFFIEQTYLENATPLTILLPKEIFSLEGEVLDALKIKLEYPMIGEKHDLLKLAYKNAFEYGYRKHLESLSVKGFTKKDMLELLSLVGYQAINHDLLFECNDISHISGNHTVASRSIIENGKTNPSKYRKFNIKTLEKGEIDDFASMREIMTRRLKEMEKTGYIPDLIIIDGGKGQLSSVVEVIENEIKGVQNKVSSKMIFSHQSPEGESKSEEKNSDSPGETPENAYLQKLKSLQLISLAKREEEIFLPHTQESIIVSHESPVLRLIQKIRDEAHRFAITFNRDKRITASKKNLLESLPGFGPKTRQKLLKHYGSVGNIILDAELEKMLTKTQIETLKDHQFID